MYLLGKLRPPYPADFFKTIIRTIAHLNQQFRRFLLFRAQNIQ